MQILELLSVASKFAQFFMSFSKAQVSSSSSFAFGALMRSFCPKQKRHELKTYRGVMCNDTEERWNILKRIWLFISKLRWEIWQIFTQALEYPKNVHFNGLLLSKVYIVWAKNVQRIYLSWHWRVIQNLNKKNSGLENDISNLPNFHQSTRKSQNWDFGPFYP